MAKQPPLCRKGCDFGTRHWPNERCVTAYVTKAEQVTQSVTQERPVLEPVTETVTPGEECPTCGRVVPKTNAQRQAAYRGRKS